MNKIFDELFTEISEIRNLQEEREKLIEDRLKLERLAGAFFDSVIEEYRQEELLIDECRAKAEKEHEANKAVLVELTKQQMMAEATGKAFTDTEMMEKIKTEVATHPQKEEALSLLKSGVCISAEKQRKISEFCAEGYSIISRNRDVSEKMQVALEDVRDRILLSCFATFEHIPGRSAFMPDQLKTLSSLRKEDTGR